MKVQLEKSLSLKGEMCQGGKNTIEWITMPFCCDADGTERLKADRDREVLETSLLLRETLVFCASTKSI